MQRVRLFLVVAAACALASSCTTVQTRVTGDLLVTPAAGGAPKTYHYEATEPHDLTLLAWACGTTAIVYGGFCWLYLIQPGQPFKDVALEHARDDAKRIGKCVDLVGTHVDGAGWSNAPRTKTVRSASGIDLHADEVDGLCAAPETPASTPPPA